MRLVIPSMGRPEFIPKTMAWRLLPFLEDMYVVVTPGEALEYKKYMEHPKVHIVECPEKNLPRTRNWALENLWPESNELMMMDDDIKNVLWGLWRKSVKLTPEDVMQAIREDMELAAVIGVPFFSFRAFPGGINRVRRPAPIHMKGRVVNCLIVFSDPKIRFDPEMDVLDDFELSMWCLFHHGLCVSDGRYLMEQLGGKMGTVQGGINKHRTAASLQRGLRYLISKFGPYVKRYISAGSVYDEK